MSNHGPRLTSQEERGKCPKRSYVGGESVTESVRGLSQQKRGNCAVACGGKRETDMRRVLHSRERIVYSRSDSVWDGCENICFVEDLPREDLKIFQKKIWSLAMRSSADLPRKKWRVVDTPIMNIGISVFLMVEVDYYLWWKWMLPPFNGGRDEWRKLLLSFSPVWLPTTEGWCFIANVNQFPPMGGLNSHW